MKTEHLSTCLLQQIPSSIWKITPEKSTNLPECKYVYENIATAVKDWKANYD